MPTIQDDSCSVRRGYGRILEHDGYRTGVVATPHGLVWVCIESTYAVMDFVYRGRQYRRTWRGRTFTDRGMATVAGRFAAAIATGK